MRATVILAATALCFGAAVYAMKPAAPPTFAEQAEPAISLRAGPAGPESVDPAWQAIGAAARAAVQRETPAAALPFVPAAAGQGGPMVVAHYLPVFPLSIDGKPPATDYYARGYLDPEGEGGKHRAAGGFLRERPLPPPVALPNPNRDANAAMEVARAARIGIDGFAVDLLSLSGLVWKDSVRLLDTAAATAPAFRIAPEPDMGSLKASVTVEALADALSVFHRHPAGYRLADGRLLVMPFMAERRPAEWWRQLSRTMAARGLPIAIVPVFLDATPVADYAGLSPATSVWGDRYATGDVANRASAARARRSGIAGWIMPVAAQDYRPKDSLLMEARNTEALRRQWLSAIAMQAAGVQLVTWNDYSESSQLEPSSFSQFALYDLNAYYIAWFKRGRRPAITRDALYFIHRPQIVAADTGARKLTVRGPTPLANDIEVVSLLTAPGELVIQTSAGRTRHRVPAGLATTRVPAAAGRFTLAVTRGGRTVAETRSHVPIDPAPTRQDATYGGGSSTRPFVPVG